MPGAGVQPWVLNPTHAAAVRARHYPPNRPIAATATNPRQDANDPRRAASIQETPRRTLVILASGRRTTPTRCRREATTYARCRGAALGPQSHTRRSGRARHYPPNRPIAATATNPRQNSNDPRRAASIQETPRRTLVILRRCPAHDSYALPSRSDDLCQVQGAALGPQSHTRRSGRARHYPPNRPIAATATNPRQNSNDPRRAASIQETPRRTLVASRPAKSVSRDTRRTQATSTALCARAATLVAALITPNRPGTLPRSVERDRIHTWPRTGGGAT